MTRTSNNKWSATILITRSTTISTSCLSSSTSSSSSSATAFGRKAKQTKQATMATTTTTILETLDDLLSNTFYLNNEYNNKDLNKHNNNRTANNDYLILMKKDNISLLSYYIDELLHTTYYGNNSNSSIDNDDLVLLNRIDTMIQDDYKTALIQSNNIVLENNNSNNNNNNLAITTNNKNNTITATISNSFEWIHVVDKDNVDNKDSLNIIYPKLALQSINKPILDKDTVVAIRQAAQDVWNQQQNNYTKSRFTYQSIGNSEVHLSDFQYYNQTMTTTTRKAITNINQALQQTIYPMIRQYFYNNNNSNNNQSQLYVYDALVIRYNATAAAAAAATDANNNNQKSIKKIGAGQPLHRDYGIVTVNIQLSDNDEFHGGGTFYEHQMMNMILSNNNNDDDNNNQDVTIKPLKPSGGSGHGVAHWAWLERHAGAGTVQGIREILVIFIAVHNNNNNNTNCNILRASRLKQQCRQYCEECCYINDNNNDNDNSSNSIINSILCRIRYQKLALDLQQQDGIYDGEVYQYLGLALSNYYSAATIQQQQQQQPSSQNNYSHEKALWAAIACFQRAIQLTPCDSRNYNNLAIALTKLLQQQDDDIITTKNKRRYHDKIIDLRDKVYQIGIHLLECSEQAGCQVENELDNMLLNYGLDLANQDIFDKAYEILQIPASKYNDNNNDNDNHNNNNAIYKNAFHLRKFCAKEMKIK